MVARHNDHRPPGWDRGKKVGWGNCNVPPGQAKKAGMNCGPHHHAEVHQHAGSHPPRQTVYVHRPAPRVRPVVAHK
jgi:hypothetical protein